MDFCVLYGNGGRTFSLAKISQAQELMISTEVPSLLFVKMESAILGLNLYVHSLILCLQEVFNIQRRIQNLFKHLKRSFSEK